MENKNKEEHEEFEVKYIKELNEYFQIYMSAMINEIYVGVGINLGMSEKKAYSLAKTRPGDMQKAKFFSSIFSKFKNIFNYKIPKFRYKKKLYEKNKPMTNSQWEKFNKYIDDYWSKYANPVSEDVGIKSYMLGKETTEFREKKKPYKNKSLFQISEDQFGGDMPDSISEAYNNYDFKNSEKKIINKSYSNIAMYVKQTDNNIQEAIRQQIVQGIDDNLSPTEISSNMYWEIEKGTTNKYTAEALRKNWGRIATTELATVFTEGTLAPYESQAMESMKDPEKAIYMVRIGGTCDFCKKANGTLMRLIPSDIADSSTNKLSNIGIKDANVDLYTYIGQNNVGRKQKDWFTTAVPAHPNNVASLQKINIKEEWFNPKTGDIEKIQKKQKHVPQQIDYAEKVKDDREYRKPTFVGSGLVRMNDSLYESVESNEYNKKLKAWQEDPTKPIPVNRNSPSYRRIFEEAENNERI